MDIRTKLAQQLGMLLIANIELESEVQRLTALASQPPPAPPKPVDPYPDLDPRRASD